MTKIKFCGLSRRCDIEAVNELKPEYIGFVFVKTSKRYVSFEKAEELKSLLDPKIKAVGVFVNEDLKRIEEICDKKVIDIVQLHGLEEEKELNYLRSRIVQPVIKAFCIKRKKMSDKRKEVRRILFYWIPVPEPEELLNGSG